MNPNESVKPAVVPGLHGVEHIGLTVPDLDQAVEFFTAVLGAEQLYESGPFQADDNWMAVNLGVDARAVISRLAMLRLAQGPALELFEYEHSDSVEQRHPPLQNVVGGSHLAFYLDDIDAGVEALRSHGVMVLGEPKRVVEGPSAGLAWVHFLAPWGQQLELVSYPNGVAAYAGRQPSVWRPGQQDDEPQDRRSATDGLGDEAPA